jgi:hypothetical protein
MRDTHNEKATSATRGPARYQPESPQQLALAQQCFQSKRVTIAATLEIVEEEEKEKEKEEKE